MKRFNSCTPVAVILLATLTVSGAVTHFVDLNSANPQPPYTNWATAAQVIQDAVDAADVGDVVLATNGVYSTGLRLVSGLEYSNRVAVTKPIQLVSVNGWAQTIIEGYLSPTGGVSPVNVRCVYLTNGASLTGFTLTKGGGYSGGVSSASPSCVVSNCVIARCYGGVGGGVILNSSIIQNLGGAGGASLTNCILSGNSSTSSGAAASGCTLASCLISNNSAAYYEPPTGGGVANSTLIDCVLVGNSAAGGGGAANSKLLNCLLIGNTGTSDAGACVACQLTNCVLVGNNGGVAGGALSSFLQNCTVVGNFGRGIDSSTARNCILWGNYFSDASSGSSVTYSLVGTSQGGEGNISGDPLFVNAEVYDFHLRTNSPCINAGRNVSGSLDKDFDHAPRVVGGTIDIGACEFQTPTSVLSYAWAQRYGIPTDGSVDFQDADGDGANNLAESRADTNPTNALSVLKLTTVAPSSPGRMISWQSTGSRRYFLEITTNLIAPFQFSLLASNILGSEGSTSFRDTNSVGARAALYRVGIQP